MTTSAIIALIVLHAQIAGIDPDLAVAVAKVESNMNVNAVGSVGEIGLFQIRPEFHPEYTKKQLKKPEINIMLGMEILKNYKRTCMHHKGIDWLTCYNAGPGKAAFIKNPSQFTYVRKVRTEMKYMRSTKLAGQPNILE